jgi:hypothetical protein
MEPTSPFRTDAPKTRRPVAYRVVLPAAAYCPDCGIELGPETWSVPISSTTAFAMCAPCSLRSGDPLTYLIDLVNSPLHLRHFTRAAGILWFTPRTRQPHTLYRLDRAATEGKPLP